MKTLKFLSFLILFVFVACEKNQGSGQTEQPDVTPVVYERTVWVNEDVECCGVKDPLNNLEWLKEASEFDEYKTTSSKIYGNNFIFLFRNKDTQKDHIVVNSYCYGSVAWTYIYDCDGQLIGGGDYVVRTTRKQIKFVNEPAPPCDTCDEFFKTHYFIDTIAYSLIQL